MKISWNQNQTWYQRHKEIWLWSSPNVDYISRPCSTWWGLFHLIAVEINYNQSHKWSLYLHFLDLYENSKLSYRNRHHHWICGMKSCQMTINLTPFWHCQNLDPQEYQRFPKYSFLLVDCSFYARMIILSPWLCSFRETG